MIYIIDFNQRKVLFQHTDIKQIDDFISQYYPDKLGISIAYDEKEITTLKDKVHRRNAQLKAKDREIEYYKGHAQAALIGNDLAKKEALQDIVNR